MDTRSHPKRPPSTRWLRSRTARGDRSDPQPSGVQRLVDRAARLGDGGVVVGEVGLPRAPGLEPGGGPDGRVPVRRPHAVGLARARRPGQHPGGERDAQPVAQPAQVRLGRAQEVARVEDRHLDVVLVPQLHQPPLLGQPDVVRLAGLPGAHVRGDDLGRVADQQHVAEAQRPAQVHVAGDVVRHVLGVVDAAAGRQRRGEAGDGRGEVGGLGGDDRIAHRVVDAGAGEVGRVQRLVDDDRVGAVLERAHHRRGDVPRAGPHRHADDVAHGATRAATSASTSSRYSA